MTFEEVYQQIRKMHYEILDERESISKSARLSLSTWMLDILTEYRMAIEALEADRPMVIKCKPFLSEEDFKAFAEQVSDQNVILISYEAEVVSTNTSTKSTNISTDTSTDTVEVVRCKDCKWADWYKTVEGKQFCYCTETGNGGRTADDFCSYGERKEE